MTGEKFKNIANTLKAISGQESRAEAEIRSLVVITKIIMR